MMRMRLVLLLGALVIAAAGCDDDDEDQTDVPRDTVGDTQTGDVADARDATDTQDTTDGTTGDATDVPDGTTGDAQDAQDQDGTAGDAADVPADGVQGDAIGPGDVPAGATFVPGSQARFLDQQVASWALIDNSNTVIGIGVTVPRRAFQAAPTTGQPSQPVLLMLPNQVTEGTFVNHASLDWAPAGHEPALYQVPHLDLHFYGQSMLQIAAVDCTDTTLPMQDRVPEGYTVAPATQCVPRMGLHAAPDTDTRTPRGQAWEASMIFTFYAGELTGIEPMLSQQALLGTDTIELDVPQPQVLGVTKQWPTTFRAVYDRNQESWDFILSDFQSIEPQP